jgi:hypothetical protein
MGAQEIFSLVLIFIILLITVVKSMQDKMIRERAEQERYRPSEPHEKKNKPLFDKENILKDLLKTLDLDIEDEDEETVLEKRERHRRHAPPPPPPPVYKRPMSVPTQQKDLEKSFEFMSTMDDYNFEIKADKRKFITSLDGEAGEHLIDSELLYKPQQEEYIIREEEEPPYIQKVFSSLDNPRDFIILKEVLSPPKSLAIEDVLK